MRAPTITTLSSTGTRYYRAPIDTYPVSILRVDGKDVMNGTVGVVLVDRPTRTRQVRLVDPGPRQVTVQGPPGGVGGIGETRTFPLDVAPCTRYYLVAVKSQPAGPRLHGPGRLSGAGRAAARPPDRHRGRMPDPLLDVRHLRVEFPTRRGTLVALDDISFSIAPGEILGVVGESGAGKSLTGAAIIGLLDPPGRIAGGEIRFDGRRIDNLPYEEMRRVRGRSIGAIFQDPLTSLDPLYTIGQQLIETIQTHLPVSAAEARRRAVRLLQETGIPAAEERLDQYPHQFSGGMRQRVVIALALAGEPKLIVADEPTTALDVSIQAQIISLLKRLCKEHGAAVMLVTHDMGVIAETCDRVAVMYAGRVVEIGPVDAVIHSPAHPYTVGLMGSIPAMDEDRDAPAADRRRDAAADGHPRRLRLQSALPAGLRSLPGRAAGPPGRRRTQAACWLHAAPLRAAA